MKRKLLMGLILSPLLAAGVVLLVAWVAPPELDTPSAQMEALKPDGNKPADPQKLVFLLQYIGIDYAGAVRNGEVVNPTEYDEMVEFSETALAWYETLRPENTGKPTHERLQQLQQAIAVRADVSQVQELTRKLIQDLSTELSVISYPTRTPDLGQGQALYESTCAPCHGITGSGKGPVAHELNPPPSNFQDPEFMNRATPYQFFNAMTYGVQGTAMPSHQEALNEQQRWDIAFYLMTLRKDLRAVPPERDYQVSEIQLATSSNEELRAYLRSRDPAPADDAYYAGVVDYFRANPPEIEPEAHLRYVHEMLTQSLEAYQRGDAALAIERSLDAYLRGIEPLEPQLAQNGDLVRTVETEFTRYRAAIRQAKPFATVKRRYEELKTSLVELRAALEPSRVQWGFVALQSLTIILREGIEAALLIALMLAYLVNSGNARLRRHVMWGTAIGIVAGVMTWLASRFVLQVTPFQQGVLEGLTSLLAAAVLFSVSFWLLHKIDIAKWKDYIRSKTEQALGTGSGIALAMAAFLAVFREAFETVLFYQVLLSKYDFAQTSVVLGFGVGVLFLAIAVTLIFKLGMRIPLKPFFSVSGLVLGLLAFVFAGYGVRELQNLGVLNETVLPVDFSWGFLEIHPTLEGLALQGAILVSFLLGWFSMLVQKLRLANKVELEPAAAG